MSPSRNSKPSAMVGIDIGSDLIKVVEAKCAKDGITITGLAVARVPQGVIENEVIVNPQALGEAIKAMLAEAGIKTKKTVSSVSGQSRVVVRVIDVPKMGGKELAETMKWEVERHVPFPPNEVIMDFQPLDRAGADPNAQNMEVLLAVAQEELIDNHVAALQAAGLRPTAIDVEPLAASRALIDAVSYGPPLGVFAIVNIGCKNTDLSVFEDGILTFPSPPLGIAGTTLTQEISEALGQSLEQAELTKREYAAVDLDGFPAAGSSGAAQSAPDPTSFGTSFGPSFDTSFDLGTGASATGGPQPSAPNSIIDEPVNADALTFGGPEPVASPQPAANPEPSIDDIGGTDGQEQPGPTFDFGSPDAPVEAGESGDPSPRPTPKFDLGDDEPGPSMEHEAVSPEFDLSDAFEGRDPGDQVDYEELDVTVHGPTADPSAPKKVLSEMEQNVFKAISGPLMDLAVELRRSLEYYSTKYSKVPMKIYLCGGTAKIPNLDKFLSTELGIAVEVADPLRKLRVSAPSVSPPYMKEIAPLMSVSVGLAIRDMLG